MTDDDTLDAVERWFRSRGIPHFIGDYSASRDVFTRAVPTLTVILVLELVGALNSAWPWWANLGVAAASLGALLGVWRVVNVVRKRPARARPDRVGPTELALFVLLVPAIDLSASQRLTAGFYFTVYVLTDATYRREFLDEVLVELRQAFAVRAVYLASRASRGA